MPVMDKIILEGNISRINETEDKYIWFDICKNESYTTKTGEKKNESSFFSCKIDRSRIKNDSIFKVGSWVVVSGIPKSYIDKNGYKQFNIFVLEIEDARVYNINENKEDKIISYDTDGVMLWHGKRCESEPASEEEIKEMQDMINSITHKEEEID